MTTTVAGYVLKKEVHSVKKLTIIAICGAIGFCSFQTAYANEEMDDTSTNTIVPEHSVRGPEPEYQPWTIQFKGYIQEVYDDDTGNIDNDRSRLRVWLNDGEMLGAYAEFDISVLQDDPDEIKDANWAQRFYLRFIDGNTEIQAGRLFLPSGCTTYWPGGIVTAKYPGAYPWQGYYGYGLEVDRVFGPWLLRTAVSGASDLNFDDDGQFNRAEVSGQLKRSFEDAHISVGIQGSEGFFHSGVDFGWIIGPLHLTGGIFHTDTDETPFSGLLTANYQLAEIGPATVSAHAQIEERTSGDEVATAGLGLNVKRFYIVADYEYNFDAEDTTGTPYIGTRFNW